ncbi:uncharacterized protein LOC116304766 [Actinia tenebrosa]|uniref:Uncharacterized protein LOC116304766 n=1 Tax=Actinia tenebrosa TaxID=6105 RepID=A0A6P8IU15_ACTTE|nr:uncharacterized protein LOC116304766 [Actinia tenebrosa]
MFKQLSKFRHLCLVPVMFSKYVRESGYRQATLLATRSLSSLPPNDNQQSCCSFADVLALIEKERARMSETNPLFPLLRDESIPPKQRLAFAPYMLYFSIGCPDILTYWMRIDKPEHELSDIEKRVNTFVNEDNFHYNFYLRDLETLGWSLDKFGSTGGLLRHVWASESSSVRLLMYEVVSSLRRSKDPLVALTVVELLEAGLYDLFTIIYKHIAKAPNGIPELQYFGDAHVNLEQHHTVTSWFSGDDAPSLSISDNSLSPKTAQILPDVVKDVMNRFDAMYWTFYEIVKKGPNIYPGKYNVKGTPPIDKITKDYEEIRVLDTK